MKDFNENDCLKYLLLRKIKYRRFVLALMCSQIYVEYIHYRFKRFSCKRTIEGEECGIRYCWSAVQQPAREYFLLIWKLYTFSWEYVAHMKTFHVQLPNLDLCFIYIHLARKGHSGARLPSQKVPVFAISSERPDQLSRLLRHTRDTDWLTRISMGVKNSNPSLKLRYDLI